MFCGHRPQLGAGEQIREQIVSLGLDFLFEMIPAASAMGGKRTFAGDRCAGLRLAPGPKSSITEPHSAAWGRAQVIVREH